MAAPLLSGGNGVDKDGNIPSPHNGPFNVLFRERDAFVACRTVSYRQAFYRHHIQIEINIVFSNSLYYPPIPSLVAVPIANK